MERLWGYAINGRISEEIVVFLFESDGEFGIRKPQSCTRALWAL